MDGGGRSGQMSNPSGEDEVQPVTDKAQEDREARRENTMSNIELMRTLRKVAAEAHTERRKYMIITISAVIGIFAFRQFIPPAWTLWLM